MRDGGVVAFLLIFRRSGTGRMAHLKDVNRRFKNGFREGGAATKKAREEST